MEHYCVMVKSGGEKAFKKDFEENSLKSALPPAKITFFKKRMRNSKQIEYEQTLFPGYVFMSTEKLTPQIVESAKKSRNFYRFLDSNKEIKRLQGNDCEILSNLLKFGETQGISKAYFDKNQKIVIKSGPLLGFEGKIVKVNRKRGRATVQINLCSNQMKFDLAFEEIKPLPDSGKS